jgi:uncharacterized coiled-coil DUF342 family protein
MTDETIDEDDDFEQLNVRVPRETKEAAKDRLDHGGLTREIRETLHQIAYGTASERADLAADLEALRDERRELRTERDYLNSRIENLSQKIERKEARLNELLTEENL